MQSYVNLRPLYRWRSTAPLAQFSLKTDVLGHWVETEWIPNHPEQALVTLWTTPACTNYTVLTRYDMNLILVGDYTFAGYEEIECSAVVRLTVHSARDELTSQSGAFLFRFTHKDNGETVEILVMSAFSDNYSKDFVDIVCLACIPREFLPTWGAFADECLRLYSSLEPTSKVVIIGGRTSSFAPTVDWQDIILPPALKADILEDVEAFFTTGIEVYKRLKLKPFRKLLLAGVPGTGKTMLCTALAKWALERNYLVIYVSSADPEGAKFWKIEHALAVAANSNLPTLILLEELDAYLHEQEKALVLNVLDGSESSINDRGSLLIATTNYPEAIDERVLKRPGRLDRIYIIPETRNTDDAEKMLRQYLGEFWHDDYTDLARQMVGYPGAFIREVAIYALTQVAYANADTLTLDIIQRSFDLLKSHIDARDDFLKQRARIGL